MSDAVGEVVGREVVQGRGHLDARGRDGEVGDLGGSWVLRSASGSNRRTRLSSSSFSEPVTASSTLPQPHQDRNLLYGQFQGFTTVARVTLLVPDRVDDLPSCPWADQGAEDVVRLVPELKTTRRRCSNLPLMFLHRTVGCTDVASTRSDPAPLVSSIHWGFHMQRLDSLEHPQLLVAETALLVRGINLLVEVPRRLHCQRCPAVRISLSLTAFSGGQ